MLLDKYFNALIDPENMDATKSIAAKLSNLRSSHEMMTSRIAEHLHHIKALMTDSSSQDAAVFREEHARLEDDLTDFVKAFRAIKREIFGLTEHIARTEKLKHLISR